ncbi:glutathione S-transferase [Terrihabitans soli]|uniref:Glutathione S-transferase n=1 Tax=Terrihabitans soli TaxID=708113 RepID=A0A6S6QJR7_9HYPH|nr:glutathione binding-like protein [Terrihabitans soli]BCJ90554.1 glutathione S-transferase [Terrihabitans soli]
MTMKLYYTPGACSLAGRIALHEANIPATFDKVDLKTKKTEEGADFTAVNPKGYVPALVLDGGEMVTENIAVLSYIADQSPSLGVSGPLGRTKLIEMLAFISTEIHKAAKPFFKHAPDADKAQAREAIANRLDFIAKNMRGPFLFGEAFSVADAYLFVNLRWARMFGVQLPAKISDYFARLMERGAVRTALAEEGLS